MKININNLAYDMDASTEGVWVETATSKLEVKIRSAASLQVRTAMQQEMEGMRLQYGEKMAEWPEDETGEALARVVCGAGIVDWRDVMGSDGVEIPWNPEVGLGILIKPEYAHLVREVLEEMKSQANFRAKAEEAVVKN